MTIYRPGQKLAYIGGGVRVVQPGGGAVAPWFLSGGIAAASCIAAYCPKGALSLLNSYDNVAAPGNGLPDGTYDAAPGVAPTWAALTGWTFDGATQYLLSAVGQSFGAWSFIVQYANRTNIDRHVIGWYRAATWSAIGISPTISWMGSFHRYMRDAFTSRVAPALNAGNQAICGNRCFMNGVYETTVSTLTLANTIPCGIGARSLTVGADMFCGIDVIAFAMYNVIITDAQTGLVAAAMAAL